MTNVLTGYVPDKPPIIEPQGLDEERRRYLFNEITQFCKSGTEDLVAPDLDTI